MDPGFSYEVPSSPDATFAVADSTDDSLQNFFSRPIKTQSYSWGTGTNLFETFNPWQDYFENSRVINRISNYHLLRCKLHVKFVINGNGFHYGRAICSYTPLASADNFTKDRAFFQADVVAASHRPHIYLDPTKSQGGEMSLPFVWKYNALDIPNQEWRDMGDIIIHGMQNLKHANGATDSVTVSVFVWATDVSLAIPTATEPGAISPQAGEYVPQADEYGSGVISKPASIIARAAGALKNAPVIGAYARATEIGASAIANIATAFGYSRPAVVTDIAPYKPTYFGNLANTNVGDSVTKLTYDAKQEVTVDTRTMGLDGTDEMTLTSIATRESYLTEFPWPVSETTESLLWNSEVSPIIWNESLSAEYHMPACCFAGLPFEYWRGTMKFRFQVVASAFHKGRLKIVYDPAYPVTNEYNTNYTRIIDLAEERDFTVEIGWGSNYPYLRHRNMFRHGTPIYKTTALGGDPGEYGNGIISVYVVNELTVPNSTANNDIAVNVFVSAGDDIEFAGPTEEYIHDLSWYIPQAGEYVPQAGESGINVPDADNTTEENAPMQQEPDEMMATDLTLADHTNDIFFGDPVVSIRQLLKRYCMSTMWAPATDGIRMHTWRLPDMPLMRGYDPDGVHEADGPKPFNYTKMTLLNYFTPAFTCYRGGVRWKYCAVGSDTRVRNFLSCQRQPEVKAYQYGSVVMPNNANSQSVLAANHTYLAGSSAGAAMTPDTQNPALEIELPYYSNERFKFAKNGEYTGSGGDMTFHGVDWFVNVSSTSYMGLVAYAAAAEDFTLGFFTGAPVAYRVVNPPAV
jgi:hypothetical protein